MVPLINRRKRPLVNIQPGRASKLSRIQACWWTEIASFGHLTKDYTSHRRSLADAPANFPRRRYFKRAGRRCPFSPFHCDANIEINAGNIYLGAFRVIYIGRPPPARSPDKYSCISRNEYRIIVITLSFRSTAICCNLLHISSAIVGIYDRETLY